MGWVSFGGIILQAMWIYFVLCYTEVIEISDTISYDYQLVIFYSKMLIAKIM